MNPDPTNSANSTNSSPAGTLPPTDLPGKTVRVRYFALLREERGLVEETIVTKAATLRQLYDELRDKHGFALTSDQLRVAIKDAFVDFESACAEGSEIIFVPPVAGG